MFCGSIGQKVSMAGHSCRVFLSPSPAFEILLPSPSRVTKSRLWDFVTKCFPCHQVPPLRFCHQVLPVSPSPAFEILSLRTICDIFSPGCAYVIFFTKPCLWTFCQQVQPVRFYYQVPPVRFEFAKSRMWDFVTKSQSRLWDFVTKFRLWDFARAVGQGWPKNVLWFRKSPSADRIKLWIIDRSQS